MLVGMRVVDGTLNDLVAGMGCFTGCLGEASFDVVVADAIGLIGGFVGGVFKEGVLDERESWILLEYLQTRQVQ